MRNLFTFLCFLILLPVVAFPQKTGSGPATPARPRLVSTKPTTPCSERDFIQAVDTHKTSLCQNAVWVDINTSTGNVAGPASSTDNAITRFDGTGGKTLQNSGVTIDDSNNVAGTASVTPGTAGTGDVGSATKPYGFIFFSGSSGTPGTNNFKFIGASTSGTRTISAPDANTLLPIFSQRVTFTGPSVARSYVLPDADTTICGTNSVCAGYQAGPLTGDVTTSGAAATIAAGAVTEAKQTLADNTTLDVSITKHGYVPKAPNDSTKFLNGLGGWAVPPSGITGSGTQNAVPIWLAGGTSLGDSPITYDGSSISFNGTPLSGLTVNGEFRPGFSAGSAVYVDGDGILAGTTLTNGQLLIGSNGANPMAALLNGEAGISIVSGPGSITIAIRKSTVNVSATASTATITDGSITSSSNIIATAQTNDATCAVKSVVSGSGAATINMSAACTAQTTVAYIVMY